MIKTKALLCTWIWASLDFFLKALKIFASWYMPSLFKLVKRLKDTDRIANIIDSPGQHQFLYMSHVTRKPVFGVCDQVRLQPVCSADEISQGLEILGI